MNSESTVKTEQVDVYYRPLDKARHLHLLKLLVASALLMGVIIALLFIFVWPFSLPPTHVAGVSEVNEPAQGGENENSNQNSNQNSNTVEVNVTVPMLALPTDGTVWMNNPVTLNGYGQPGLQLQIFVDGKAMAISSINEAGEWVANVNLGEPGIHHMQMITLNQSNQVINVSQSIEVVLLDSALGEMIKSYPNLPSCGQNTSGASPVTNPSTQENGTIWYMPQDTYPILCVDESGNNNNAEPSNTPIPVTNGKG